MGTYYAEFTKKYSSGTYTPTIKVKATITDTYDPETNTSVVKLTAINIYSSIFFGEVPVHGKITLNGTVVANCTGGSAYTVNASTSYTRVQHNSSPLVGDSITVPHNTDGSASVTVGVAISDSAPSQKIFGFRYNPSSGSNYYFGVTAPNSKSVAITTQSVDLTIDPNGGSWNGSSSLRTVSQAPTTTYTLVDPVRAGYTFTGWTLSGGGSLSGSVYTYGGEVGTVTAQWEPVTYTISFDANGGEDAPEAVTKGYGQTVILPEDVPEREGFDFLGWSTDSTATTATYGAGGSYAANESAVLYAVWRVLSFTVSATISERGIAASALRTSSANAGAPLGGVHSGDTVYYGDVISISWEVENGYRADVLEVNGEDVSELSSTTVNVTSELVAVLTVKLGAIVYINGVAYQAFIDNGSNFNTQYEAYIDNGSTWVAY